MNRKNYLLLTAVLSLLLVAVGTVVLLDRVVLEREEYPYRAPYRSIPMRGVANDMESIRFGEFSTGDFDGNGSEDLLLCTQRGLLCLAPPGPNGQERVAWQSNFPDPTMLRNDTLLHLRCSADLDGDGCDEAIVTYKPSPPGPWRLRILNHCAGTTRDFPLPNGDDINGDGAWDGSYFAVGSLPGIASEGRAGLVLIRTVGYDRVGRGIYVYDPEDGREIWSFIIGPNPHTNSVWTGDIDGDGHHEVVIAGGSPNNFGSQGINGTSDDRIGLYVLSDKGELIWSDFIGTIYYGPLLAVADCDASGSMEILLATRHHSVGEFADSLIVYDGSSGRRLSWTASDYSHLALKVSQPDERGYIRIHTADEGGRLRSFRFEDGELRLESQLEFEDSASLITVGDILPDAGDELVVNVAHEWDLILSDEHDILAAFPSLTKDSRRIWYANSVWNRGGAPGPVMTDGVNRAGYFFVEQRASALPFILFSGWLALIAGANAIVWRRKSRSRGPATEPATERESLARLLEELEESSHGSISALSSLRHLGTRLGYAHAGEDRRELWLDRIRVIAQDFVEMGHPQLIGILDLADRIDIDPELTKKLRVVLDVCVTNAQVLAMIDFPLHALRQGTKVMEPWKDAAVAGFRSLRDEVERRMSSDAVAAVERTIVRFGEQLDEVGIRICFENELKSATVPCLIDSRDIRFILESLFDNARRAMIRRPNALLTVKLSRSGKFAAIRICDTGTGVPATDHEHIFERDHSTKKAGGLGLFLSRKKAAACHGSLVLEESSPDQGSTFLLRLRFVDMSLGAESGHLAADVS